MAREKAVTFSARDGERPVVEVADHVAGRDWPPALMGQLEPSADEIKKGGPPQRTAQVKR